MWRPPRTIGHPSIAAPHAEAEAGGTIAAETPNSSVSAARALTRSGDLARRIARPQAWIANRINYGSNGPGLPGSPSPLGQAAGFVVIWIRSGVHRPSFNGG
jgi:hypothetical protein